MPDLRDMVDKVRSKNAGPFWITIDIFCGSASAFERVSAALDTGAVAALFDTPTQTLKRFDIADLHVIKISFPRPTVQGAPDDRDMHGASYAAILGEMTLGD